MLLSAVSVDPNANVVNRVVASREIAKRVVAKHVTLVDHVKIEQTA
jgi:hypothetical protein